MSSLSVKRSQGGIIKVMNKRRFSFPSKPGFTVIELVVSLGIMVTIMTAVFANYPESNIRVNLALLAHTITLSVREAQLRGTAIESQDLSVGGYGVFFDRASTSIVTFKDFATEAGPNNIDIGDGRYATSSTPGLDETDLITLFPYKFKMSKLCVGTGFPFNATNSGKCNTDGDPSLPNINTITIGFVRPNPQPILIINQNHPTDERSSTSTPATIAGVCIEVSSEAPNRAPYTRSAQVYTTGRIMASKQGCQ
ncbi:MAG: Type secretion system protein [Patescibacteria group bacterium]|nr:Type secretion system protein [Patescibacteria group bacterium]